MDRKEAIEYWEEFLEEIPEIEGMPQEEKDKQEQATLMAIAALQQPQVGGWIPVSERLPENGCGVLVTVNGKHNNIIFVNALEIAEYRNTEGWIIEGYLDWLDPNVIAWQPLPEPYKEGEEE